MYDCMSSLFFGDSLSPGVRLYHNYVQAIADNKMLIITFFAQGGAHWRVFPRAVEETWPYGEVWISVHAEPGASSSEVYYKKSVEQTRFEDNTVPGIEPLWRGLHSLRTRGDLFSEPAMAFPDLRGVVRS